MTTTTDQRRAMGDGLNALAAHLQQYARFTIGRVTIHADAGHFEIEIVDRLGYVDARNTAFTRFKPVPPSGDFTYTARAITLDEAFVALAHKLAGTEDAPADWGKR